MIQTMQIISCTIGLEVRAVDNIYHYDVTIKSHDSDS
jgi:hypothetical protein